MRVSVSEVGTIEEASTLLDFAVQPQNWLTLGKRAGLALLAGREHADLCVG